MKLDANPRRTPSTGSVSRSAQDADPIPARLRPVDVIGQVIFPAMAGLCLGLALLKLPNPAILESQIAPPLDALQALFMSWPAKWGYWLLAVVGIASLPAWRLPQRMPAWLVLLPGLWLAWQFLCAARSVDPALTRATLKHFTAVIACFYIGLMALGRIQRLRLFWIWLLAGFAVVIMVGWRQHFGGLEETRRFFYDQPDWRNYPPEFLQKLASNRISSTLFYPNNLAGVILMLLPASIAIALSAVSSRIWQMVLSASISLPAVACLYWSGSKAGWLIGLLIGSVALAHLPTRLQIKLTIATLGLLLGLSGMWFKHADYFSKGATSASARADYWKVALQIIQAKPIFGSGPGSFFREYGRLKPPEAEMARLAHNDYLQQGTDSGILGLLTYSWLWIGSLAWLYRKSFRKPLSFGIWLGVTGLALHNLVEFGLYIPATGWLHFTLLGWLLGHEGR